jgi:sulfur-oxidizing protein SoxX
MHAITRVARALPALLLTVGAIGCATAPGDAEVSARAAQVLKSSFNERGQAKLDRLDQDDTQRLCSDYAGKPLPQTVAQKIEEANKATLRYPADGKLVGDWKNGERIAQEGRGMQFSDDPTGPTGANCYACHQLTPQEVSYGTIGPSLYRFGKVRGYGVEMQKYAYGKIFNAEAFAACTNMPRFGHKGILSEQQLRDVTALLMDPQSPVNQ